MYSETIIINIDKYHWIEIESNGIINMYLDHHALSSFRMCEGYFDLAIAQSYGRKGGLPWPLSFGIVFHSAVEYIYTSKAINEFNPEQLREIAIKEWNKAELDKFKDHKTYIALGGLSGFIALLIQYTKFYSADVERMRPIATEVTFGKAKEVFLGRFSVIKAKSYNEYMQTGNIESYKEIFVNCYLTGRIDFLMDNGTAIGPMDHKTSAYFKNNPMNTYETQEGMTGYIFATNEILKRNFPELLQKRQADRMWMNFIQIKSEEDSKKRFRRVPLFKTPWQLEQFKERQLTTFKKIFEIFILNERKPDWNTNLCNSWYYQECQYRQVHRQGSESSMELILNSNYVKIEPWNPEKNTVRGEENGEN